MYHQLELISSIQQNGYPNSKDKSKTYTAKRKEVPRTDKIPNKTAQERVLLDSYIDSFDWYEMHTIDKIEVISNRDINNRQQISTAFWEGKELILRFYPIGDRRWARSLTK